MVTVAEPRQSTIAETRRQGRFKAYVQRHREFVSALAFLVIMLGAFTIISPGVFLRPQIYTAIFISLPISIILAVSLVFVIVGGEVDLAFPSVVGISAMVFTIVVEVGANPWIGLALALAVRQTHLARTGVGCGGGIAAGGTRSVALAGCRGTC